MGSSGRLCRIGCAVLVLSAACAGSSFGQQTDPKILEEIQALKKGQEEIRKQLEEIKQLIKSRPAAAPAAPDVRNVPVDLGNRPTMGNDAAKLTLVEFSDYQCPFCARHTKETHPQLVKEYIDSGKLRYAFFDFPLESIHKLAFKAAEATRCAGDQGKYWEMHELLFASQKTLEPWSKHAEALGLDAAAFEACMTTGKHANAVRADIEVAKKLGMTGTPGFLLAEADPKDSQKVKGLVLLKGAKSFDSFKTDIDKALGAGEAAK